MMLLLPLPSVQLVFSSNKEGFLGLESVGVDSFFGTDRSLCRLSVATRWIIVLRRSKRWGLQIIKLITPGGGGGD